MSFNPENPAETRSIFVEQRSKLTQRLHDGYNLGVPSKYLEPLEELIERTDKLIDAIDEGLLEDD